MIRGIEATDFSQMDAWLASDPEHSHITHEDFTGQKNMVIEDEQGVVLYARMTNVWRVGVQFDQSANKLRVAKALKELVEQGSRLAAGNGVAEIVFSTEHEDLAQFMKRFGFYKDPETLRKEL